MPLRALVAAFTLALTVALGLGLPQGWATAAAPSTDPSARVDDPALTGAPIVGKECYTMTFRQAGSMSAPHAPVKCTASHTNWVFKVGKPKASLDLTDRDDVAKAGDQVCRAADFKRALGNFGLKFSQSAYGFYFFAPTKAEVKVGAHWISCTAALMNGKDFKSTKIAKLPKVTKLTDSIRLCVAGSGFYTVCSSKHVSRSTYAFWVHKPYSVKNRDKAAMATCPKHVSTPRYAWKPASARPGDSR